MFLMNVLFTRKWCFAEKKILLFYLVTVGYFNYVNSHVDVL